jgi:hypothetical protein
MKASSKQAVVLILTLAIVGASAALIASDRVGVYGIVDKVVFEPSADNPERVQVWGAFAVATREDRDNYQPVKQGYLYFTPGDARALALTEWNDLKSVANKKKIVAFGSRLGQSVRVRPANEEPQNPDKYVTGVGVQTMQADRDYAPIRALTAYATR